MTKDKKKIRADFRKNRNSRVRESDLTRSFDGQDEAAEDRRITQERISGKGDLTRRRTVTGATETTGESGFGLQLEVDPAICRRGRVLQVHGLRSVVEDEQGKLFRCATRRLLRTLSTDQRHVVAAGDYVWFRPADDDEGIVESIEPRRGVLSRESRGRRQILVANVDQVVIVSSAAEPYLKPNLIDRFLASAHHAQLRPLIVINKVDLVELADLMPLVGVYSQMGYQTLLVSAKTGRGIERLRSELGGQASVFSGQSGVGKSSLLNAIDPSLQLRVATVSTETQKGRHTTTTAQLWPLASGGYVVDTPGIKQFQLWDVIPAEVAGYFRDLRPWIHRCRYPDCTHTHEADCAVKNAVGDGRLDARRYESYCAMFLGDMQ